MLENTLALTSPAFENHSEIPVRYTCEGEDISPPLHISGIPKNAKVLALIVDDPDAPDPKAPKRTWVHWVVYNIPAGADTVEEGEAPQGSKQGTNDWHRQGYGGPCPPIGRHRYFFKLYALKNPLQFTTAPTKHELETAMKGNILAEAELMGTYEKKDR